MIRRLKLVSQTVKSTRSIPINSKNVFVNPACTILTEFAEHAKLPTDTMHQSKSVSGFAETTKYSLKANVYANKAILKLKVSAFNVLQASSGTSLPKNANGLLYVDRASS